MCNIKGVIYIFTVREKTGKYKCTSEISTVRSSCRTTTCEFSLVTVLFVVFLSVCIHCLLYIMCTVT